MHARYQHRQELKPKPQTEPQRSSRCGLRESLFWLLAVAVFSSPVLAQAPEPVAVQKLHSFALAVTDLERSLRFYQDVFAAQIQARADNRVSLRIGSGPHHFTLEQISNGEQPGFKHIGLSVANFDVDRVQQQLAAFGVLPGPVPPAGQGALDAAMRSWVEVEGDTRRLFFADVEGIRYQLSSGGYCGGRGLRGEQCAAAVSADSPGLMQLLDINHFTSFLANRDRANDFITRSFGKQYQAFQGPGSPVIGVGDGKQFLMYVGGSQAGTPANPGQIHHVSFAIEDFDVDAILQRLTDYGLSARPDGGNEGPLMHWVSMRMPNRGGAEGGTPEVYFSDPDGIRIQVQDAAYCGGGGYLGDNCPPLN